MSFISEADSKISQIPVPEVDFGDYIQIDGYNVSKTVLWFYNLTRYDTSFKPTNASLLGDEAQYAQTLGIYAAMAGIFAIALTIFLILFCCCNCMFRSAARRQPLHKGQRASNRSSCILGFIISAVAIAGAATFVVGFIGEVRIHNGADAVCYTADNVSDTAGTIKNETENIKNQLEKINMNDFQKPVEDLEDLAAKVPNADFKEKVKFIKNQYTSIKDQVEQAKKTIIDQILDAKFLDTMIDYTDKVKEECPNVKKWIRVGSLVVLIILAISSLLFIIGLCNNCFRSIFTLIGYFMFNVLIVFGIVSFLALIAGSDFCLESKKVVEKHVKEDMLNYYLYCDKANVRNHHLHKRQIENVEQFDLSQISNLPILSKGNHLNLTGSISDIFDQVKDYIDQANGLTENFTDTVDTIKELLEDQCQTYVVSHNIDQSVCQEVNKTLNSIEHLLIPSAANNGQGLVTNMKSILNSTLSIVDQVDCTHVTELINETFSTVCTDIYEAFFFFLMNSLAATLCFYILLLLSIWMLF